MVSACASSNSIVHFDISGDGVTASGSRDLHVSCLPDLREPCTAAHFEYSIGQCDDQNKRVGTYQYVVPVGSAAVFDPHARTTGAWGPEQGATVSHMVCCECRCRVQQRTRWWGTGPCMYLALYTELLLKTFDWVV